MRFDFAFILQSLPLLVKGAGITLGISAGAIVVGLVVGLLVALGRLCRWRWLAGLIGVYVSFIRGTPLLVQVLVVFLVIPAWLDIDLPALPAGIAGMGLNSGAFMGEVIRGGIQSVPRGQVEAARALGMSSALTTRRIILPQVFNMLLPAMTNEFVTLVKASSILSSITVVELTRIGNQMVATYYKPAEIYITVALLYLVINLGLSQITVRLEQRASVTR